LSPCRIWSPISFTVNCIPKSSNKMSVLLTRGYTRLYWRFCCNLVADDLWSSATRLQQNPQYNLHEDTVFWQV
jgi:hypothetical protein